jgi:hypothetical protein
MVITDQAELAEQSRARRASRANIAKKRPGRRGPIQTEVKEERSSLQADVETLVLCS